MKLSLNVAEVITIRLVTFGALVAVLTTTVAHADTRLGPEFRVNPTAVGLQRTPRVAHIGNGAFAVAWESIDLERGRYRVYVRPYAADGTPLRDASFVGPGNRPDIAALAGGGYVVVVESTDVAEKVQISARVYENSGVSRTPLSRVTVRYAAGSPAVAALTGGGFVVLYLHRMGYETSQIVGRRFTLNAKPVGPDFLVNEHTSTHHTDPRVAALASDGFVAVWHSYGQDGPGGEVFGRRLPGSGPSSSEFHVNTYSPNTQVSSGVAVLNDGGFVIVWYSRAEDGSLGGVYARRYDASGAAMGAPFRVNTATNSDQGGGSIAALSDGGFVIVWTSKEQDGSGSGIYAQRYAADSTPVGNEFRVNKYRVGDQQSPSVAPLLAGGYVVVWQAFRQGTASDEIYGQRFGP